MKSSSKAWELIPPLLGFLALPAFLYWLRTQPQAMALPEWAGEMPLWPIVLLALAAPSLLFLSKYPLRALAFAMLLAAAVLVAGVAPAFAPYGDPGPVARQLAELQARHVPLGHLGKYHATYNFAGRLREPIEILDAREVKGWVAAHPDGQVITVERSRYPENGAPAAGPAYQAPFRGAWLQIWQGAALLVARPELR